MAVSKKQIIILGAGYGGLHTALKLEKLLKQEPGWRIILIDRYDSHQLKTELHEVAAGRLSAEGASVPIAALIRNKNIDFLQTEVTNIDFAQRLITTSRGKIAYERLVVALGGETEFYDIPGLSTHSLTLTSIEDAARIRTHIREMFVSSNNYEKDDPERVTRLTLVVGGGGFTGVELATELMDYTSKLCKEYEIDPKDTQLVVVEASDTILPGFDLELTSQAQKVMKAKGIRLMLKAPCVSAGKNFVELKSGERIYTQTLIWTGGVRACDLVTKTRLKHGPHDRVIVNPYLESVDRPDVYVIGDNSLVLDPVANRPLAPSAQLALQQAEVAALNLYADVKRTRRSRYVPKMAGEFVSLGDRNAVGWLWRLKVSGVLAWFLKRMSVARYLYSLGGLRLTVSKLVALLFS